jgi:hypothetical protein
MTDNRLEIAALNFFVFITDQPGHYKMSFAPLWLARCPLGVQQLGRIDAIRHGLASNSGLAFYTCGRHDPISSGS